LFKHNNYASFVRQLNMYGFHKKVGLSDNSMKASERKNKSPSEYYNPYFRRGHPNLLWLINKPKSSSAKKVKGKRQDDGSGDSDDEIVGDDALAPSISQQTAGLSRALPAPEAGPLQKKEMALVRDQVQQLQESQRRISDAIARLRHDHIQLQAQALAFQSKHERHENSINAILHFLANVFRKSVEEQGGVQNANDLLASFIPNMQMPQQGQQGSVVDLGDMREWVQQPSSASPAMASPPKRQQRLLPPIPQQGQHEPDSLRSPSDSATPGAYRQPQMGSVTELYDTPADSSTTPAYLKHDLDSNPQEEMLRIIQDANSNVGSSSSPSNLPIDLSEMVANSSSRMTPDERNRMLSIMSGHSGAAASAPATMGTGIAPPPPASSVPMPASTTQTAISPLAQPGVPALHLAQMSQTQEEIDQLQRLQADQSRKLDDLSHLLGPLSPSGKIPGLDDAGGYFGDDIDFGQYLDNNAYGTDGSGADLDFSTTNFDNTSFDTFNSDPLKVEMGGAINGGPGHIAETNTPSHKSPSPAGTEEISRDDLADSPGRSTKRQRRI
jgi:heat shock transcription factor, other eukaryote